MSSPSSAEAPAPIPASPTPAAARIPSASAASLDAASAHTAIQAEPLRIEMDLLDEAIVRARAAVWAQLFGFVVIAGLGVAYGHH
jgi:hypothetical protein